MCKGGKYKYGKIKYDCERVKNASTNEQGHYLALIQYYSTVTSVIVLLYC